MRHLMTVLALAAGSVASGASERVARAGVDYVRVPHGMFVMGCVASDEQCEAHERPTRRVTLTRTYWMSRTEVTVKAYRTFATETLYTTRAHHTGFGRAWRFDTNAWDWIRGLSYETPLEPGRAAPDEWPSVQIAWGDAAAYCKWAGGRLPTEAEWERAARGGHDDWRFPWGNAATPQLGATQYANAPDESMRRRYTRWAYFSDYDDRFQTLAPVASFAPNPYGLYDMAGNAWEWVADWYAPDTYLIGDVTDPRGPEHGTAHVARGGAWAYAPEQHRASERGYAEEGFWTMTFGFRCVLDDPIEAR